jgi:ubiquinone/menaquinone biosynthesis C-methylase UbiE
MWREVGSVRAALRHFGSDGGAVLDVPCGTGVAAAAFNGTQRLLVAADISLEMMQIARPEYRPDRLQGMLQSDITRLPASDGAFDGAVVLGFMHRVPPEVKESALREIARVSRRFAVVSFSVDSGAQRLKQTLVHWIRPGHAAAPAPMPAADIDALCRRCGFRIVRAAAVAPPLSAERVYWLERASTATLAAVGD